MPSLDEERRPSRPFFQMTDECGEIEYPLDVPYCGVDGNSARLPVAASVGWYDYRLALA
jgi:hypothetical protein